MKTWEKQFLVAASLILIVELILFFIMKIPLVICSLIGGFLMYLCIRLKIIKIEKFDWINK